MAESACGSRLPPSGRHWSALDAGPKAAVGETVVGFGGVERLGELALGDVADEAEVASAGLQETVTVEHAQGAAIPGAAQERREVGTAAAHGVQHGGELLGEKQQTAIACLLAHHGDEAARGKTRAGDAILGPGGIYFGEEAGDLVPAGSLAGLAGFSDEHEEEVQGVPGGSDHAVWSGADEVAKGGEQLQENGLGLGLGVRGQGAHGFSGEAIERAFLEYGFHGLLGLGCRFLAERRPWLWLGFRRERSRIYGETVEAGLARLKLRRWAGRGRGGERRRLRGNRVEGSRAGLALGVKAGLGEQFVGSLFYVCEGGRFCPVIAPYLDCLSSFATLTVAGFGRFPSETSGSWRDDPPACLACMRCDPASGCTPPDVWFRVTGTHWA